MSRGGKAAMVMAGVLASLLAAPTLAQTVTNGAVIDGQNADDRSTPFTGDDLLFMEVTADGYQLAETMNVYASRSGVYVPLGEFARILDFAVGVFPAQHRAEGWVLSRDHSLVVDLNTGRARVGGVDIAFDADQIALFDDDVYVRTDLLERLIPVRLTPDVNAQTLVVIPTQPLPFQQRLARERRRAGAVSGTPTVRFHTLQTPYLLASPPAFDVNLGGQVTRDGQNQSNSYDVRMAGDLLWAGFQGYAGSDAGGALNNIRVQLERKDPDGHALGALGATRAGIGDVFTPSMSMGAGSIGGRGVYYTSAPLESLDLATPLNLRGELPLGEEVELYINEVLQTNQSSPVAGRYEFLDVPLTFGLNTVRLVFYGAQGETREKVRRINFGTGQVGAGHFIFRLGAVQQNTPVFRVGDAPQVGDGIVDRSTGEGRFVALFDYGVSAGLTLSGGVARYAPLGWDARSVGMLGLRSSFAGMAGQLDLAADGNGGAGITVGLAGRPFDVSVIGRHSEYSGGFVDETRLFGVGANTSLLRSTDLRADALVRFGSAVALPLSVDVRRQQRTDGNGQLTMDARTSLPISRYYLSTSLSYQNAWTTTARQEQLVGAADVATLVAARAQFRGGIAYRITPDVELETAYATVDYQVTARNVLRFSVQRSLGAQQTTTVQASSLYTAARFDASLNAAYETDRGGWQLGLQLGFGFGYNPVSDRYMVSRPGLSTGGSIAINAFIDANGDSVRQADEQGVRNVAFDTPGGVIVTNADGLAMAGGLGDGGQARLQVNLENIDDPFLVGGDSVAFVPRPGRTVTVDYPLQLTSEVELTTRLRRDGLDDRTLAAVNLQLVPVRGGDPVAGRTDHAGVVVLEGVRPGRYEVRLDPVQAADLGLSIDGVPVLDVPARGGYVRGDDLFIRISPRSPT
jgi:hypothetical protein